MRRQAKPTPPAGRASCVRFFGGWSLPRRPLRLSREFAKRGLRGGRSHGLATCRPILAADRPGSGPPIFAISCSSRDPGVPRGTPATPLQRVPDREGLAGSRAASWRERVYEVARAARRTAPACGSDDVRQAAAVRPRFRSLFSVWRDPDFDPAKPGLLLRPRGGEPDLPLEPAALHRQRSAMRRSRNPRQGARAVLRRGTPADHPGAGLDVADLVSTRQDMNPPPIWRAGGSDARSARHSCTSS